MQSSSDDEDEGSASGSCPVLLGFLERAEAGSPRLQRHRFPSKVGGLPAWLEPAHLPAAEQLLHGQSGRPLKLLLQVYAPVDRVATAFHRTVFLFVAPEGDQLHQPGAVRAFRSQLPRANPFYSFEPAVDGGAAPSAHDALCAVAGWSDPSPFPEWELVIDEEPDARDSAPPPAADASDACAPGADAAAGADYEQEEEGDEDDLADFEDSAEQAHFSAFTARMARAPAQCLRYGFDSDVDPLWPSRQPVPSADAVPPCSRCGAARRFEFQVMPQLLNYLDIDADSAAGLDFGTIAVYSCSESCALEVDAQDCAYAEEFVFVQSQPALQQRAAEEAMQAAA